MTDTITYSVPGIHCEHCARAIREEVSEIEGVESGRRRPRRPRPSPYAGAALSDGDVREAIAEAGYEVA